MADPMFTPSQDEADDLPRTFRREKEAREREARERAARERAAAPSLSAVPEAYAPAPAGGPKVYGHAAPATGDADAAVIPSVVKAFDVPFLHLTLFFLKAVVAAVPAIILLAVILGGLGAVLELLFPSLVKMKILIGVG